MTARQEAWLAAARTSDEPAASFFRLLALPNEQERGHDCRDHALGFRRDGRRGFKCGICGSLLCWKDDR
jgi:hypothetical protein